MSHLIIKKLRYQNFLNTGNNFTEIDFTATPTTLVLGENGAGKSAFTDALMYGLFGKAYRNINVPSLINSITDKHMLVEVELSTQRYPEVLIRRGLKPRVYDILINGEPINQLPDARQQQDWVEKNILGISANTFSQVAILGSANYQPFMQLSAAQRRQIVEDLLDLGVFTQMNEQLKIKAAENKDLIQSLTAQISQLRQIVDLASQRRKSLSTTHQEMINTKQLVIDQLYNSIKEKENSLSELENQYLPQIQNLNRQIEELKSKIYKYEEVKTQLLAQQKSFNQRLSFFDKNESCPSCGQRISHEYKEQIRTKYSVTNREIDGWVNAIDTQNLPPLQQQCQELTKKIEQYSNKINSLRNDIQMSRLALQSEQKSLQELCRQMQSVVQDHEEDLNRLYAKLDNLNSELTKSFLDRDAINVLSTFLKDQGIKALIVKQYIPIINKLINKYLTMMEFMVNFEIDENFNEQVKSRYRDIFSYYNFSEGEKARLDLALLFAWRELAQIRHSAYTNLLILDEVFDGSADDMAQESFVQIMTQLTGTNVFIITHRGEQYLEKFDRVLRFRKNGNFSRLET